MNPSFVSLFCKQTSCPSSELLLCYRTNDLPTAERTWIASHLCSCEFCGAELQLLTRHRPGDEECPAAEMPLNLRHLAEALLSRDFNSVEMYTEVAYEKAPLTLTDA
jgi:hypothetical protein